MSKKSIECYDNLDHEEYIKYIFLTSTNKLWADEVRWLKKYKYVPEKKCVCCENKVSDRFCLCNDCLKNKIESNETFKYINKNKNL